MQLLDGTKIEHMVNVIYIVRTNVKEHAQHLIKKNGPKERDRIIIEKFNQNSVQWFSREIIIHVSERVVINLLKIIPIWFYIAIISFLLMKIPYVLLILIIVLHFVKNVTNGCIKMYPGVKLQI